MAQRSFKLDDDLDARLVKEAGRQGRSVSNLILWAITRELGDPPPQKRFDGPNPNTHRGGRLIVDGPVEGTPLPKIAPRKKR